MGWKRDLFCSPSATCTVGMASVPANKAARNAKLVSPRSNFISVGVNQDSKDSEGGMNE